MADIFKLNPKGTLQTILFSEPSPTASTPLSLMQMADVVLGVGLRGDQAANAIAAAYAVSGFDPSHTRLNQGEVFVGLWGLPVPSPHSPQFDILQDPYRSAEVMVKRSGGATSWEAWPEIVSVGSKVNVRYRSMISNAQKAVDSKGGYS